MYSSSNITKTQSKYTALLFYLALFLFLTFILSKAPLISDDFEFADYGYTALREILPYVLYYGNGRLLGNIGVVFFINFPLVCAAIKSVIICGIIYFLARISGKNTGPLSITACLLTLGLSPLIFAQVFTWTSGFMNYVPPVLCTLICIHLVINGENSRWALPVLSIVALCGQLFVEHATVINILISGVFIFAYRTDRTDIRKRAVVYFIASVCGAIIMFLIPKIFYLEVNRTTGYRRFEIGNILATSVDCVFFTIHTLSKCSILFAVLSFVLLRLLRCENKQFIVHKIVYIAYPILTVCFSVLDSTAGILKLLRYLLLYGGMVLYFLLAVYDVRKICDKTTQLHLFLLFCFALVSILPFLIARPFGERCLYLAYIFFTLIIMRLMDYVIESGGMVPSQKEYVAAGVLIVMLSVFLCCEFTDIEYHDDLRSDYIQQQMKNGKTEITIFDIPSDYAFITYLTSQYYYYEERGDIRFTVVDFEVWESEILTAQ